MKKIPHISAAEWEVMKVLWKKAPLSAQEVIEALVPSTGWSAATIKTLLNRLAKKKALSFKQEGKAYWYSPACDKRDCRAREVDSFLDRVFDGSLSPLLAHFVSSGDLSAGDLKELESLLKNSKGKKR